MAQRRPIKDLSGTVTLTKEESADVLQAIKDADAYLKNIDSETFSWLEKGNDLIGKDFLQQLKAHVNNAIRAGGFEQNLQNLHKVPTKIHRLYD